jgi:hypothetical protein
MMFRALESSERAHTLLTGRPASAKSLFMLQIEKFLGDRVYFAEWASTTKAGSQRFIEGLLSMMERGEFTSTKVRNTKTVALLVLPILVVLRPIKITITTNTMKAF